MLMCRDLAKIASDYIDNELGTGRKLSVKMHLLMCKHCRSFIGNLRTSTELLKGRSSEGLNDELIRQIDQSISEALVARKARDHKEE